MSRMTKKQYKQTQVRAAIPPGGVPLDQVEAQKNAMAQSKVESIAATIYAHVVSRLDASSPSYENECVEATGNSIDAALIFAREVWGVNGKRQKKETGPVIPPQPIVEG